MLKLYFLLIIIFFTITWYSGSFFISNTLPKFTPLQNQNISLLLCIFILIFYFCIVIYLYFFWPLLFCLHMKFPWRLFVHFRLYTFSFRGQNSTFCSTFRQLWQVAVNIVVNIQFTNNILSL